LPREPVFGVDLRAKIVAPPNKKFVICDLSQIEPRCTAWLVGDSTSLAAMRAGYGVYEAFAKSAGVWDGEVGTMKPKNKELYALCKAQVLALGYGCGPAKFVHMAKLYADLELSIDQAREIVRDFRLKNPLITNFWNRLERMMKERANSQSREFRIQLPSGRCLRYTALDKLDGTLWARLGYTGLRENFWGGKLLENVVQATARDVLAEGILRLEFGNIPVVFSAHDETVCEVDEEFDGEEVRRLMTLPPEFMKGLPLEAEFTESKYYLK
jgi:DNA polymerase